MDVKAIVSQMTLEEKAALCSGKDFWHLQTPERLGIKPVMVSTARAESASRPMRRTIWG